MSGHSQSRSLSRGVAGRQRILSAAAGLALACSTAAALAIQTTSARKANDAATLNRPVEVLEQGYVSSKECRSCHPTEHASWASSYHRTMTQVATPQSVFGTFDGVQLGDGGRYRLEREGQGFFVDVGAVPGESARRYPMTLVTGSHHMQIYWFETGTGRALGQLPFVYLKADRRWVPRDDIFIEPPRPPGRIAEGRWNASCIACHTTRGQPRINAHGDFDTRVAEFGIACEACHGPGEGHLARNRSPLARYGRHLGGGEDASIVNPKKLTHERASLVCAQCHSTWLHNGPASMRRWNENGLTYRPGGDPFGGTVWLLQPSRKATDARVAKMLANERPYVDGLFWSDGMMRVSGREFNGMIDSACYARGELSCLSCHAMHQPPGDARPADVWSDDQLQVGMDGDRACLQCHGEYAGKLSAHTQHAPDSPGSRCYNCHMPYTSYGLLKALRSHRIDVPGVNATVAAGRPNACNLCHVDKSLGWTAAWLKKRYGIESPALDEDQENVELGLLLGLTGDAGQRALIAWALGWGPARAASNRAFMPALLGVLMDDPYDAVRYIAERSLRSLPDVDTRTLKYDFVQRPAERESVASSVANLGKDELTAAERQRLQMLIEQLGRRRDDRPVRLLE
jgi:hypothetical protein